jgi:hypothetical protein
MAVADRWKRSSAAEALCRFVSDGTAEAVPFPYLSFISLRLTLIYALEQAKYGYGFNVGRSSTSLTND